MQTALCDLNCNLQMPWGTTTARYVERLPLPAGLAQTESTYLRVRRPPCGNIRPDLAAMQCGAELTARLLRAFGPAAERCLGAACAQELLFALEGAMHPSLAPHALPPVVAACTTLEMLLRRGGDWAVWDPTQPDVWQYIPGGWASMSDTLPHVRPGIMV